MNNISRSPISFIPVYSVLFLFLSYFAFIHFFLYFALFIILDFDFQRRAKESRGDIKRLSQLSENKLLQFHVLAILKLAR